MSEFIGNVKVCATKILRLGDVGLENLPTLSDQQVFKKLRKQAVITFMKVALFAASTIFTLVMTRVRGDTTTTFLVSTGGISIILLGTYALSHRRLKSVREEAFMRVNFRESYDDLIKSGDLVVTEVSSGVDMFGGYKTWRVTYGDKFVGEVLYRPTKTGGTYQPKNLNNTASYGTIIEAIGALEQKD